MSKIIDRDAIISSYQETGSIRRTAQQCNAHIDTVRRCLITAGLYTNERVERVTALREQGLTTSQIAAELGCSELTVVNNSPYPPEIKNAPNRYCLNCGKPFYSLRGQALYCSDCSSNARAKTTVRERVCADCGAKFMGWPRSKRCPDCQAEAKLKYDREHKQKGSARKLGSVDICAFCGKEYTVEAGSQKYCKACAAEATRQNILAHKKEYNAKNQKRLKGIAKAKQEIIKEPPDKADKE